MRDMAALLLVLAAVVSACSGFECPPSGKFWDGCNWCFCTKEHVVVGCTNMSCLELPLYKYRLGANRPTIGPPKRPGLFAYKPGRGVVANPAGWPCQLGSSWLEEEGCVRCSCTHKMIQCRDSNLCQDGQMNAVRRRRDTASANERSEASAGETTAAPAAETTAAPAAETAAAPAAGAAAPPAAESAAAPAAETAAAPAGETASAPATETASAPAAQTAGAPASPETGAIPGAINGTHPSAGQATVVKERSCKSGSTWEEDCNACWCLDNGRAACTTATCEAPSAALPLGAPKSQPPAQPTTEQPAAQSTAQPVDQSSAQPGAQPAEQPAAQPAAQPAEQSSEQPLSPQEDASPAPTTTAAADVAATPSTRRRKRRFVMVAT